MPITRTLSEALDFFGAKAANSRWGWAAQSADGETVVLTMWRDQIEDDGDILVYGTGPSESIAAWTNRQGNRDRITKLRHAWDHCGGLFRGVIIEAVDTRAGTRSTRKKYHADATLVMKLEGPVDPQTGVFRARSVKR
ncbi:MAG: hypothetical protein ABI906_03940 [Pseudomonadota bacterium]